jgi:hypothetical protein
MVAEHNLMTDDLLRQIIGVGRVDLLVGAPHSADPEAVRTLVRAARACFRTHFPRLRAALLSTDGPASDRTASLRHCWMDEPFGREGLRTMHLITATTPMAELDAVIPRLLIAAADLLQARAVVFIDPDTIDVTPQRIATLAAPLADESVDLVMPVHPIAPDAGLLVTQLVRPLTRGLLGLDVYEPLLPAFGTSARFASHCAQLDFTLDRARWVSRYWITTEAIANSFPVSQQPLGPRRAAPSRSGAGFAVLFRDAVQAVFANLDAHSRSWLGRAVTAAPPPVPDDANDASAPAVGLDGSRLASFEADLDNLQEIIGRILAPDTLAALRAAAAAPVPGPRLPAALWADVVAEFLLGYRHNVILRDHVVQALLPLYMARTETFLLECADATAAASIELLCMEFERAKPHIVERWAEPAMR